jgi:DNA-binding transcriptional regulator YiaG
MEMTLSDSTWNTFDFTNPASAKDLVSDLVGFTAFAASLVMGPGAMVMNPRLFSNPTQALRPLTSLTPASPPAVIPACDLVIAIKERWKLNMTEVAQILGVTRPTLYNWVKGKNPPDASARQHLQTLAASSAIWVQYCGDPNHDFLLDYTGPMANETSIRQAMSSPRVKTDELCQLIKTRHAQYTEAREESRQIIGEPLPFPQTPVPEESRRLNELWARNAKALNAKQSR